MLSSMCHGRRSGSQEDQKTNSRTRFELEARAPRFWSQKGSRSPWCEKLSTLPLEQRNHLSQSISHQTHFAKTRTVISGFQNLLMSERMQAQTDKNKKTSTHRFIYLKKHWTCIDSELQIKNRTERTLRKKCHVLFCFFPVLARIWGSITVSILDV